MKKVKTKLFAFSCHGWCYSMVNVTTKIKDSGFPHLENSIS